ncbi:adenosylcobinamide-GDP ribazoletransferase [Algirhabdus cladophorae]|uniref:adenosylcobinamide-GDP ribazoletransferase n=1 Tax=Algirhabdus cladophorae TaxID=3377108 RepID=UPI003B846AFD
MAQNDIAKFDLSDLAAALGLLSRLPVKVDFDRAQLRGARAVWAYPLVGVVIGALAGLVGTLAHFIGVPPMATAALMVACSAITTGAMHEDGLADSADGLWGGWDKEHRLKIMKDSYTGVYGVVAIGLSLILRVSLLAALVDQINLIVLGIGVGALSRAPMVALMHWLPNARDEGLSASVGSAPAPQTYAALALGTGIAILCFGSSCLAILIGTAVVTTFWAGIAKAKIQGQTGDILGAGQQLSAIAALLCISAALH